MPLDGVKVEKKGKTDRNSRSMSKERQLELKKAKAKANAKKVREGKMTWKKVAAKAQNLDEEEPE